MQSGPERILKSGYACARRHGLVRLDYTSFSVEIGVGVRSVHSIPVVLKLDDGRRK